MNNTTSKAAPHPRALRRAFHRTDSHRMQMINFALLAAALVLLSCILSQPSRATEPEARSEDQIVILKAFKKAEVRTRYNPQYPNNAAHRGTEGWVYLRLVIEPNGSVSKTDVLDSEPPGVFDKAAQRAVERWVYDPAMEDGQPIQSTSEIVLSFALAGSGASRKFASHYKAAVAHIEAGELDDAFAEIRALEALDGQSQYEQSFLHLVYVQYYLARKDYLRALEHLTPITRYPWSFVSKKKYDEYLVLRFNLEAKVQHYTDAHHTFVQLNELKPRPADGDVVRVHKAVLAILDGPDPISQDGLLEPRCDDCDDRAVTAVHNLYRPSFFIDQINGKIETLGFYCGRHFAETPFDPAPTWTISDQWGECSLHVEGQAGTTYRLVEINP